VGAAVRLAGVEKSYGPVRVLLVPELELSEGQVVGLVGENGAGKSTLMGILAGTVTADAGVVEIGGVRLSGGEPDHAQQLGVAMVSQEFPLVDKLSVAENLFLNRRPAGAGALFDRRLIDRGAEELLRELGVRIPVRRLVETLQVPQRQMIELAKALGRDPRVLVLDEPTSALGPVESDVVIRIARERAARGDCVLFVGHRLEEVRRVADRVLVLRNGRLVADLTPAEATEGRLIREMVGRELEQQAAEPAARGPEAVLEVRGLTAEGLGPIDLRAGAGEIVGVAGLMGSGRSRLLRVLMAAQPRLAGEVRLRGRPYAPRDTADAIAAGVGMVPEDRKLQSLLVDAPVRWNLSLAVLPRLPRHALVLLSPRDERALARRLVADFGVRCRTPEQAIRTLSGGNQQRAVFARWFATEPALLLLDEPTRGIDVGAKAEIYHLVEDAAARGMAVVVVSSELEELMLICHRIVVMARGRVTGEMARGAWSKERIMTAAAGAGVAS
jgi:ribose transport system ATP-binding protein